MQTLARPFDSAPRLLGRSARVFFGSLPFLAAITLAVFVPGKLLFQGIGYLLGIPPEGIASYVLMDFSDLVLGSLAIPAVIYGLTAGTGVGESLRRGWALWPRMFWNRLKVEVTVALWMLLLFVPGLIAMVKLFLTEAAVVMEEREPDPLERSRELTAGRRWRVFGVAAPLLLLDFGGSIAVLTALPGVAHSRLLMAAADSVMAIIGMWATVAGLLIYLGVAEPPAPAPARATQRRSKRR